MNNGFPQMIDCYQTCSVLFYICATPCPILFRWSLFVAGAS